MKWTFNPAILTALCLIVLVLVIAPAARTQSFRLAYLKALPTAQRVKAEIHGGSARDTAARQMRPCWQLDDGPFGTTNADENGLAGLLGE